MQTLFPYELFRLSLSSLLVENLNIKTNLKHKEETFFDIPDKENYFHGKAFCNNP